MTRRDRIWLGKLLVLVALGMVMAIDDGWVGGIVAPVLAVAWGWWMIGGERRRKRLPSGE